MSAKVYVGNLSWNTTDETLRNAFTGYGQVIDSIVMRDRDTGRSRGFGFVTFASEQEAQTAIAELNEKEFEGRRIKVNYANQRPQGGGGGGGYNSGGGQGGYGGGGFGGGQGGGFGGNTGGGYGGYAPAPGFSGGFPQQGGYPQQNFGGQFPPQQPPSGY